MAKAKAATGIQNRHIYTRASYLYQAANYLAHRLQEKKVQHGISSPDETSSTGHSAFTKNNEEHRAVMNISRQVVSDMRAVSLKAQIRQSPAIKRTICKFCDTLQIEGKTCRSTVKNASKGGKKPWADVLVIRCNTCGNTKRYPVSAPKQKRKSLRIPESSKAQLSGQDATESRDPTSEPTT